MSNIGEMHSDLMCAPGLDLHIQKREVLVSRGDFKDGMSSSAGVPSKYGHASAILPAASDPRFYVALLFGHPAIDQCDVSLENAPIAKLIG
jgi:hypothetical protein